MDSSLQKALLREYMEGWKEGKKAKVLGPISDDCIIIESHGPTYCGKAMVGRWFDEWHVLGNQVKQWNISSFYSCEDTAFSEWSFSYSGTEFQESFEGITIVKFKADKIFELREYRQTVPSFLWQPSQMG